MEIDFKPLFFSRIPRYILDHKINIAFEQTALVQKELRQQILRTTELIFEEVQRNLSTTNLMVLAQCNAIKTIAQMFVSCKEVTDVYIQSLTLPGGFKIKSIHFSSQTRMHVKMTKKLLLSPISIICCKMIIPSTQLCTYVHAH